MKYEEAIKVLRFVLDPREYPSGEKSKCYQYNLGAINKAIYALEKQIPKKPEFVGIRFMNNGKYIHDDVQLQKCYRCPNCNSHIFHVWDDEKHCKYCGQKIDWSDNR